MSNQQQDTAMYRNPFDAEKFAEWLVRNEREVRSSARAGDRFLDPICLFLNSQLFDCERPVKYLVEQGVFKTRLGREIDAPEWVNNYWGALEWKAGGCGNRVTVDIVLEAIADALYLECVKAKVRRELGRDGE
jgi:hypothetical protein